MIPEKFLAIIIVIIVVIIIFLLLYYAVPDISTTARDAQIASDVINRVENDLLELIAPFQDVNINDVGEFLTEYYKQECLVAAQLIGFCSVTNPNYNKNKCPPLCELVTAVKITCVNYEVDNSICNALEEIPIPIQ